jgi:AraC-like DNA-binding protein
LREAVRGRALIEPFADAESLLAACARGFIAITVLEVHRTGSAAALTTLRRLHENFPDHPVIAWCDLRSLDTQTLLAVARLGVHELIRQDGDDLPHALAHTIANASQRSVSSRVASELADLVPPRVRPVFEYALEHAGERLSREAVAAVFGISRRTLHNRLDESGLHATREFLTWCRVLVASALLEQPGHTLDSIAGQLDFPDGGALGKTLRRYTGYGITELRKQGAVAMTLAAFRETVREIREAQQSAALSSPLA